jgi:hypothetical protein
MNCRWVIRPNVAGISGIKITMVRFALETGFDFLHMYQNSVSVFSQSENIFGALPGAFQVPFTLGGAVQADNNIVELRRTRLVQGLILVPFIAQPEPFLTQNTPKTPRDPPFHLLDNPYTTPKRTPIPQKALTLS